MCAWITLDKPSREHIFSHFLCHRKGISLAVRQGFNWSRKYRNDRNILMTHLFCSVSRSCLTLCNPMDCSTPGFPVHHLFPELAQTHVHWVGDAIQPFHPLPSPSLPAFNLSQHRCLFQWVSSSHQVAKVLDLQLQHQSFQCIFRTDIL